MDVILPIITVEDEQEEIVTFTPKEPELVIEEPLTIPHQPQPESVLVVIKPDKPCPAIIVKPIVVLPDPELVGESNFPVPKEPDYGTFATIPGVEILLLVPE